jgi:hypothetical protein
LEVRNNYKALLSRFNNNLCHFHVAVPQKIANPFVTGNNRRIICAINKTDIFQSVLMPLGVSNYFININKKFRDKLELNSADEIEVHLQKDESEFGLPIREEFKELLFQYKVGNYLFHQLTAGKQPTVLYSIGKPKSTDLRIRNGIVILEYLKNNKSSIDYKQLNFDMKNSH